MTGIDFITLKALFVFCFVMGITPGPNNTILLSMSVRYGVKKALPCYFGIVTGFPFMVLVVSYIVSVIGSQFIEALDIIKYAGTAFLLYLAYKLFMAKPEANEIENRPPVTYLQMAAFQWMNPKAWTMAATAVTFVGADQFYVPSMMFVLTAFTTGAVWLFSGDVIRRFILGTKYEAYINKVLAILLIATIYMLF